MVAGTASGCKKKPGETPGETKPQTQEQNIEYIQDEADLAEGAFYVKSDAGYAPLYIGEATFNTSGNRYNSDIAWFVNDWDAIPTLYEGDSLVYKNTQYLSEEFVFDRFYDQGYTFGIKGLSETVSGRCRLEIIPENFNSRSDADKMLDLMTDSVIFETMDGQPFRADAVSIDGGLVLGVEKDREYDFEIYTGTQLSDAKKMTLRADCRALTYRQTGRVTDYDFLRSATVVIKIPEYYNTGYYMVNGFGFFRYVKGSSYDDSTDFNIENASSQEEADEMERVLNGHTVDKTEFIELALDGEYELTVTYDKTVPDDMLEEGLKQNDVGDPEMTLNTGEAELVRLKKKEPYTYYAKFSAKAGVYPLTITGIYGRTIEYDLMFNGTPEYQDVPVDGQEPFVPNYPNEPEPEYGGEGSDMRPSADQETTSASGDAR